MIFSSLLSRYFFRSITPYFLIGVFIFTLINFIQYLKQFVDLAIQYNAPLISVLKTMFYLTPFLMTFTIPVGVLIGILLCIGSLNQNNEIIAIRSNGVPLKFIFKPTLTFGILVFIFQLIFFQWILPWGNKNFVLEKYRMLRKNPIAEIVKKQKFSDGNREIRISSSDKNKIYGISVVDSLHNTLYFSKEGVIASKSQDSGSFPITLYNVSVMPYVFEKTSSNNQFSFYKELTLYIKLFNIKDIIPEGSELEGLMELHQRIKRIEKKNAWHAIKHFQIMSKRQHDLKELQTKIQQTSDKKEKDLLQKDLSHKTQMLEYSKNTFHRFEQSVTPQNETFIFQRKIAFAFNSILMALLGIPLALFKKRQGKDVALGMSVLVIIIFNSLVAAGNFLFHQHLTGPYFAAWLPNIISACLFMILAPSKLKSI